MHFDMSIDKHPNMFRPGNAVPSSAFGWGPALLDALIAPGRGRTAHSLGPGGPTQFLPRRRLGRLSVDSLTCPSASHHSTGNSGNSTYRARLLLDSCIFRQRQSGCSPAHLTQCPCRPFTLRCVVAPSRMPRSGALPTSALLAPKEIPADALQARRDVIAPRCLPRTLGVQQGKPSY